eukprot:COSAG06_NODE_19692_length_826_cov_1.555708_2_plen_74_part_01
MRSNQILIHGWGAGWTFIDMARELTDMNGCMSCSNVLYEDDGAGTLHALFTDNGAPQIRKYSLQLLRCLLLREA